MRLIRFLIPSLFLMIPFVSWAQFIPEDDLYITKKDENAIVKAQKAKNNMKTQQQVVLNTNARDVDEYNRRTPIGSIITPDNDTIYLEEGKSYVFDNPEEGYVNGFNGSSNDFEMAERIRRFHNPKFTIHISDPMYNDIYFLSGNDWNVYEDGMYATITPTWTNPYYWNYMWSPSFYSGWSWRYDPWGWGYPNFGFNFGWNSGWYGPGWGNYYPGWGCGWYPGWGCGGGWYPGGGYYDSAYKYSNGRSTAGYYNGGRNSGSSGSYNRSNRYTGGRSSVNYGSKPSVSGGTNNNNSGVSTSGGRSSRYQSGNSNTNNVYRPRGDQYQSGSSSGSTGNSNNSYNRGGRSSRSSSENNSGNWGTSRPSYDRGSSSGSNGGSYGGGSRGSMGGGRSSGGRR